MRVIAHRGAHSEATVENTLAAFRLAIEEGADGVELDVQRTRSGEVVVFHDADLTRLAGRPLEVAKVSLARLRRERIGGEPIPTLDEALDLLLDAGLEVNVEVKGFGAPIAHSVARVLARRSAADRSAVLLSAFDPRVLFRLRHLPGVRTAFLFQRERLLERTLALAFDGVHPHFALCTPARVERWKGAGFFVNAWTLNDPEKARDLAALGVDSVITDRVGALCSGLGR